METIKVKNKKGGFGIVLFFIALFLVLIGGFFAVMVLSVVDIAADEITPIMTELGVLDGTNTNISEYSEYSFGTANIIVQALPWVLAASYIMALVFTLVFIFLINYNPHPAYMAFYVSLMILLVFGCIIISNMYQDIYTGTDELATRLQEQTIMSYMLLHSPFILGLIGLVGGLLMFARYSSEEGDGGGL